ncbi:MAG TPA: NADH-quinone oxidoreductase subunit N [bacterium]|nr:NADH-quinone oxidoreductase subunit N [bacterium]
MATVDWSTLTALATPVLILLGAGLLILLLAPLARKVFSVLILILSALAIVSALLASWGGWLSGAPLSLGLLLFDRMAYAFDFVLLLAALLTIFLSKDYLPEENIRDGEYYALVLFATAGGMIIAHAADLIVLFLGLEIASLSAYVLCGMKRNVVKSYEASLKYFIMGSIASGFLVYGIAMAYGAAGSTSFAKLQQLSIPPAEPVLVMLAVALILVGVGFKIAAVPFHLWSPDVYEGAPTSVTAFMATAIKTAGFAALIRIALSVGHIPQIPWTPILWTLSALTMTVGNLVAIRQHNIKRMLAYSSIAHAGYVLVGVTAALQKNVLAESTIASVLFYLFAYSLMTIGAFAVVIAIGRRGDQAEELTDYAGLSERHPFLAGAMALFLFSLTGMPPTIGFVGKFYLFSGAIEAGLYGLVVVGVLNSAVSAYYYLGPIVKMYFQKQKDYALPPLSYTLLGTIFLCVFVILYLGLFPSNVFLMARESVRQIVF